MPCAAALSIPYAVCIRLGFPVCISSLAFIEHVGLQERRLGLHRAI